MSSPVRAKYRRHSPTKGAASPVAPAGTSPAAKSPAVKQSWAAAGFISSRKEASDIVYESMFLTAARDEESGDGATLDTTPQLSSPAKNARLEAVNPGDVFELSDRNENYFFYVVEVDSSLQTASDKAHLVKPWADLLNPLLYERIVTGAPMNATKQQSILEADLTHPERSQFFGKPGKANFLALIRNSHTAAMVPRRQATDSRSVIEADMARQIFLQGCRERCLPPLPVLVNCTSSEYPKLDISNLSLGRNYVEVISMSLTAMTFLKSLDFSGNVLDSRGAAVLLSSIAETFLEELIFDHNRIGKGGMKALAHIILHTPSVKPGTITNRKEAISFTLPPITSPVSKLQIRNVTCVLKKISINDNALGDHLVASLLKALASCPCSQLAALEARGNDVGSTSAHLLADLLAQKGDNVCRLAHIDISWNNVQSSGAIKIFNAAAENGFLKSISLDFNGIQDLVFPSLAKCCNGKNGLTFVSLKNNTLNEEKILSLVTPQQLEKIQVVFK
jgi:hypothetical protein